MADLSSCQVSENRLTHGDSLDDAVTHYFGCLRFAEREAFLAGIPKSNKIKQRILEEEIRIARLRGIFEMERESTASGSLLYRFKAALQHRKGKSPSIVGSPRTIHSPVIDAATREARNDNTRPSEEREKEFILRELTANIMYFKKQGGPHMQPYDNPKLPGTFPDQKISLCQLLTDDPDKNPLMWKCEKDMMRYFHLPANNMDWIEEVMARYYNEPRPDLTGPYRKPRRPEEQSKTRMLLRPQFWRGLQHGDSPGLPTHTRHMRPRCYPISTEHQNLEPVPKNLALFMPYLHWETDRRRSRAADILTRYSKMSWTSFQELVDRTSAPVEISSLSRISSDGFPEHITTIIEAAQPSCGPKKITLKSYQGQSLLGKVFLLAAALYEELDSYTDEKVIKHYLNAKPPLQPRRTLDQSYYWTLRDTRSRDRDQVVYRGTAPSPKLLHYRCLKDPKHPVSCGQCRENTQRIPRVVMVDQLWMWMLDENTIITCFPRRFGKNKPDPSAVQKCIRARLREARIDEVRSVYDLGIIIIDQCSRVFFDRTQSEDLQPQVMDSFANAIGRVTHRQTIAFDHFWECTRLASKRYNAPDDPDNGMAKKSQNVLLDINPEGELLREIKDIIDEIFIMKLIKQQQEAVARTFSKNIERLLQKSSSVNDRPQEESGSQFSSKEDEPNSLSSSDPKPTPTLLLTQPQKNEDDQWTIDSANELVERIQNQLVELGYLSDAADNASLALKDLLDLKQQQAGVVEAREAVKQGEETLKQGRAIMLFTVITIIFLPMSFFSAVFGMNTHELIGHVEGSSNWGYKDVFKFMIPISVIVIICSLCLAFSRLVRALLSYLFKVSWTWIITKTSLYVSWHDTKFKSKKIHEDRKTTVNKMKKDALKKVLDIKMKNDEEAKKALKEAERRRTSGGRMIVHENGVRNGNLGLRNLDSGAEARVRGSRAAVVENGDVEMMTSVGLGLQNGRSR